MGTSLVYLRSVLPLVVFFICLITLNFLRPHISLPQRAYLVFVWGNAALLIAFAGVSTALLWASETPAETLKFTRIILLVGAGAGIGLLLGIVLAWLTRLQGERFLIAIFRPPHGVTHLIPGWSRLSLLLLWLALGFGASAATYGILSYLVLSR